MRDPRYDVLFEPVTIGPVVAPNRFYQVPHCNGMGHRAPEAHAGMRAVKAEGGWGVVCTEEAEIHPSSDLTPAIELRNWDDRDIPALTLITEKIHEFGSLAGIELVHNGPHVANRSTREAPIGPIARPVEWIEPIQARRMDKADIADLRRWHREAIRRSITAGFDIVYVYAGHSMSLLQHFLSRYHNDRTDEYGGSLTNRGRLLREILEDAREEADGQAGVACRLCVDELLGPAGLERGEIEEIVGMLAEHPDLWDFEVGPWSNDSSTARFKPEGYQEDYVRGLKELTTKPVVGVGRFTSPDEMVRQINSGVLDMIGAARPSIADPFLPAKLEEGRLEDIRECVGCNICVSGDNLMAPIRCTQNPTMGEEWRRGWHPERIKPKARPAKVLVVGGGPSGLEAAQALGKRGFEVVVVESTRDLGGRVHQEAALPGLATWRRVVDYRLTQIDQLPNVDIHRESPMGAEEALGYGFDHIAVATGASWRADGVGRSHSRPISISEGAVILTPDDLMAGSRPATGRVIVFDDDHYYMGGVLAELLVAEGYEVDIVTPEPLVSAWTVYTLEQEAIHRRLAMLGVGLRTQYLVTSIEDNSVQLRHPVTDATESVECSSVVMVTGRQPNDQLANDLTESADGWADMGLRSMQTIGDAWVPGTIASAVWWGHRYAQELEEEPEAITFRRE
ncbi:MAG: NADH:flavin oxidoreductase [Actinomycetia bacterium]|nr:NADH:flavin oxidoreductase [Actinomycetes bacterium]